MGTPGTYVEPVSLEDMDQEVNEEVISEDLIFEEVTTPPNDTEDDEQ